MSTADAERVVVGRIGRAHGIKGEVSVEPRTDEPERRFAAGNALITRAPGGSAVSGVVPAQLTVDGTRTHQGRLLVRFAEIADRTSAEAVRGVWLEVAVDAAEQPDDADEYYDHQLVGLRVEDTSGTTLGVVTEVQHSGAQDLLHLDVDGRVVLFPFVSALVPVVDVPRGRIVIDDRPGLLTMDDERD